ncbi:hypothetical protein HOG17_01980 [Candidatus Peregrinibacteria bacterium]|jgi:hypothetical protein|nr:hypothetical protein [Candidatus Peregrinibacteria bacterium]MBT4148492.1 hypothetical protein [Candidatus Peregrinibacteria bacterium]MBT4456418.1 hypothetical protein [Candidatus Peregrinibacteria bacterium]
MGFETPTPPEAHDTSNAIEKPKPIPEPAEKSVDDQRQETKMSSPDLSNQSPKQEQEDQTKIDQIREQLDLENENLVTKQDILNPEEAKVRLFALMDEIQETSATPTNKAKTIEEITQLLREISKTKDPKSYKFFREDGHFKQLKIVSKYLIENSLDRDLHERVLTYLGSVGIETTQDERAQIIDYFREKDDEKRRDTFMSYAQNGLLTLKSAIERGVLKESSSTPGDFSSLDDLQEFSLEEHGNVRGYELSPQDINDELFYGRNSFFGVVLERGGEEIDRAGKLPKAEVQNRLRNSMIFIMKSEKADISRRTDNANKEDIVRRDIKPEEIDYLIVDHSNITAAQEAFGHLPCRIISADTVEAKLQNFFEEPYKLPDYKGEVEKIAKNEGEVWCHIARLPVDTYPEE